MKAIDPNGKEIRAIEFIAGLGGQLELGEDILRDRLKAVPDLFRQYRIAHVAIDKVVEGLYSTLPLKTLLHMERLTKNGEIVVRMRPAAKRSEMDMLSLETIKMLASYAIKSECAICMKDPKEVKKCPLRDALMEAMPPTELPKYGRCPYSVDTDAILRDLS